MKKRIPIGGSTIFRHTKEAGQARTGFVHWSRRILLTAPLIAAGCGAPGGAGLIGQPAAADSQRVEVAALKAVYELEGHQRPVVFVEVADASPANVDDIVTQLEDELNVIVRPTPEAVRDNPDLPLLTPYDPQTGQVGVVLRVERTTQAAGDTYEVNVAYSRSGLDGGSLSVILTPGESGWTVVDINEIGVAKSVG